MACIQSLKSVIGDREILQIVLPVKDAHLLFGVLQGFLAELQQLGAPLVSRQRLLERQLALFHLANDFSQVGERGFEILGGGAFGHRRLSFATLSKKGGIGQIGLFKLPSENDGNRQRIALQAVILPSSLQGIAGLKCRIKLSDIVNCR
jgi:hypothetical protein